MSCATCTITVCKNLYIHPCDSGINTGIVLDVSGDYTIYITFAQAVQRYDIQVMAGEPIILQNVLNAPFVHIMTIYDNEGILVNDTCYKLNTMPVVNPNNLVPNPPCCAKKFITVTPDNLIDDVLYDSFFEAQVIALISTSGQQYIKTTDFTQSDGSITWVNGNVFYEGQTLIASA